MLVWVFPGLKLQRQVFLWRGSDKICADPEGVQWGSDKKYLIFMIFGESWRISCIFLENCSKWTPLSEILHPSLEKFITDNLRHVMRKPVYAICEQQRRRSACCSPASLIRWIGRFESYLVANPEDRFSRDEAYLSPFWYLLMTYLVFCYFIWFWHVMVHDNVWGTYFFYFP